MVLLIIEPQKDFYKGGSCFKHHNRLVPDHEENLAKFIQEHKDDIDDIVVPLDSHNVIFPSVTY